MNAKTVLAVAAFAVAISFAIYAPSLDGPFVFDGANIENGSRLHITSLGELERIVFADGVPRRIGLASFALNFYVHQLRPFGYHVVNVLIHAINGLFLFWFSYRILSLVGAGADVARRSALLAAILWLVHPVQTQAVAYIYQRFTSLAAMFFLLLLCTYLEAGRSARTARILLYVASFSTALLAFGTKEIAGTLPLVIVIIEIVLRGRTARPTLTLLLPLLAFGVVCVVYLGPDFVDMMASQYQQRGFTLTERLLTEARVVVHYLSLMIWPHPSRLTLDYDVAISTSLFAPPATAACMGVIAMLSGSALLWVRRYPLYSFAILWFFGNLAIESTFVPLEIAYEHRVYLPSMALCTWLAHGIIGLTRSKVRTIVVGVAGVSVLLWSFWTSERNRVWADPVALWEDNALKAPGKARVHANLGKAYRGRGRHGAAERSFRRALEIEPSMTGAYVSLANVYIDQGHFDEAVVLVEEAREREPGFPPAQLALGVIQLRRGDFPRAIETFAGVLEHEESDQAALFNLASAHFNLGSYEQASAVAERGLYYWPADARMHALFGAALVETGYAERGEESLQRAISLQPANGLALRYLERIRR